MAWREILPKFLNDKKIRLALLPVNLEDSQTLPKNNYFVKGVDTFSGARARVQSRLFVPPLRVSVLALY